MVHLALRELSQHILNYSCLFRNVSLETGRNKLFSIEDFSNQSKHLDIDLSFDLTYSVILLAVDKSATNWSCDFLQRSLLYMAGINSAKLPVKIRGRNERRALS